ncbi:MAG: metalloregulator ArsR/SmtB family transcription factor [Acidobacteriaceae bacterium]|nr:metalloregulator ArsR/SmtB family transcription factor [Acidobacteriaceae bacterium]
MGKNDMLVWSALGDPTRRRLLDLLRSGPRTTGALCARFAMSRTAVMKHLDVLEEARLITVRRQGRKRWNYINAAPLRSIYERWLTPFQQLWASSLSKFGTIVEGDTMSAASSSTAISTDEIVQTITLSAPPERVFEALTKNVARWWSHVSYDHNGRPNLSIEPTAGGRFVEIRGNCERLYGIVTRIEPPSRLHIEGGMGMGGSIFGTVHFEIAACEQGAHLTLSHVAMGVYDKATIDMYRSGWGSLLEDGLKSYVENGKEAWAAA